MGETLRYFVTGLCAAALIWLLCAVAFVVLIVKLAPGVLPSNLYAPDDAHTCSCESGWRSAVHAPAPIDDNYDRSGQLWLWETNPRHEWRWRRVYRYDSGAKPPGMIGMEPDGS